MHSEEIERARIPLLPLMKNSSRLIGLDAIRGLAAVAVVLAHIDLEIGDGHVSRFSFVLVDLFFVMSGFVISRAYDHKLLAGMRWHQFMLLRAARLYPSVFIGLVAGLIAYFVIPSDAYPVGVVPGGTYRLDWYSAGHLFLLPDLTSREGLFPLNSVYWSLFFEVVSNVVHGLVVRRLTIFRLSVFVALMAICWAYTAATAGNWGWGGGWNGATFLGGFARVGWAYAAGMLLHRATPDRWRVSALVPAALAALVLLSPNFGPLLPRIIISVFVMGPLIVALAAGAEFPPAARRVAAWLGAISYPLYTTHHPLLLMINTRLQPSTFAGITAAVVFVIVVATIVEYAYDAPVRRRLMAWASPKDTLTASDKVVI